MTKKKANFGYIYLKKKSISELEKLYESIAEWNLTRPSQQDL